MRIHDVRIFYSRLLLEHKIGLPQECRCPGKGTVYVPYHSQFQRREQCLPGAAGEKSAMFARIAF